MRNLYGVLGVAPSSSAQELRSAYRKLARICHPDRGGEEERFKEIAAAYAVLSDPERRVAYDAQRTEWLHAQGAFACRSCGHGIRIPRGMTGAGRCARCKTEFEQPPVEPPIGPPVPEAPTDAPSLMASLAELLRMHGERVGSWILLEVARAAEQVPDEVAAELTARAAAFVRNGLVRLRQQIRAARPM